MSWYLVYFSKSWKGSSQVLQWKSLRKPGFALRRMISEKFLNRNKLHQLELKHEEHVCLNLIQMTFNEPWHLSIFQLQNCLIEANAGNKSNDQQTKLHTILKNRDQWSLKPSKLTEHTWFSRRYAKNYVVNTDKFWEVENNVRRSQESSWTQWTSCWRWQNIAIIDLLQWLRCDGSFVHFNT